MAQHSNARTTLNYYLRTREDRTEVDLLKVNDTVFLELEKAKLVDEEEEEDNEEEPESEEGYESGDEPERDFLRLVAKKGLRGEGGNTSEEESDWCHIQSFQILGQLSKLLIYLFAVQYVVSM